MRLLGQKQTGRVLCEALALCYICDAIFERGELKNLDVTTPQGEKKTQSVQDCSLLITPLLLAINFCFSCFPVFSKCCLAPACHVKHCLGQCLSATATQLRSWALKGPPALALGN